ncbi:ankyrin-3, partial [Plakobranchus ocellatus]
MVKFLLGKDANINRNHCYYSPLLIASLKHPDVVSFLLKNGADVNEVGDDLGHTPLSAVLYYAAFGWYSICLTIIETLLSAGANPNKPNCRKDTVLHLAPDTQIANLLIQAGADLEARNDRDLTPLLVAADRDRTDVINVLQKYGADMAAVDDRGNSALHIMVQKSDNLQEETLRLFTSQFNQFNKNGMTPLKLASEKSHTNVLRILLELGADPNVANCKFRKQRTTPNFPFQVGATIADGPSNTALHLAADSEIASLLIQAGADLEARDGRGQTPLLTAAYRDRTDVINVLHKYGADMAAVDNRGKSALHIMVQKSDNLQEETLRLFTSQFNQFNKIGMTPLMLAAENGYTKTVRILLDLGADPNIVKYINGRPHTALSIVLDIHEAFEDFFPACAEELITRTGMTGLPRCCWYFFNMIDRDQRRLVQLMVTHGMAPLCEKAEVISQINYYASVILDDALDKLSPLAFALVSNRLAIAQYLKENWFLTPSDLVGSMELRHLRSELERESQADSLRFMDENLSQPMSLLKLSFVAVSAQLGGVAGREER